MADIVLEITITDALVPRTKAGLSWHYGLVDPTNQELRDYVQADLYRWIARRVADYEGSIAEDAAKDACLADFGL